jgi:hypothetical protein
MLSLHPGGWRKSLGEQQLASVRRQAVVLVGAAQSNAQKALNM